jgi:hypothetical protein
MGWFRDEQPGDEDLNEPKPQSTADLLDELGRIREECGDFLHRYQQACGVRTPAPRKQQRGLSSSVERRRAILHLLIEELIT